LGGDWADPIAGGEAAKLAQLPGHGNLSPPVFAYADRRQYSAEFELDRGGIRP
jgi:hypothetical protein